MKLFTEVFLPEYPFQLDHQSQLLMLGSCFTENIGNMLKRHLFPVSINPFGVIYNPHSVKKGVEALLHKEAYTEEDLDFHNDLWFSFDHYTLFSSPEKKETLNRINLEFKKARTRFQQLDYLILTWGTAWVYHYKETGEIVCNCHKIPASRFSRSRLSVQEIVEAYHGFLQSLFGKLPDLKVIFTVSPVRHWKDGAHGNQLSKSTLLLAQESLLQLFPDRIYYFPSYEIMMDELRDYRYYGQDMLHTNPTANQHIWERFEAALLSPEARKINNELSPLLKLKEHRPRDTRGEQYQKLIRHLDEKKDSLQRKFPQLSWGNLNDY
jgi:hypothetical protein